MRATEARLDELIARLRERGYRLTPQRMAVLKAMVSSHEHLAIEQIYERVRADFPMTSLATIYKTVALLKDMGEVVELNLGDDCSRYEARDPTPHPHLVCVRCRQVVDLEPTLLDELSQKVAWRTGYRIMGYRLNFFGHCPECQKQEG
ncbi:MAG: Fur family transcriptional regulator [Anaerolineae bacterium]